MKKEFISEYIWLNYFNQYLYEKGIINENERNKISNKIPNITFKGKDEVNLQNRIKYHV